jgi:CheY-like chemotaxis protein
MRPRNRILIVEDQPTLQRLWTTALTQAGFITEVAGDGLDACLHVLYELPDVIVLDLSLPRMRGDALLHELRRNGRMAAIPRRCGDRRNTIDRTRRTLSAPQANPYSCATGCRAGLFSAPV